MYPRSCKVLYRLDSVCGVPRYMIWPFGFKIASNSFTASESLSRCCCVAEFFGTSTSSAIRMSARIPVICPVIPIDFTEGEISGTTPPTSNIFCVSNCPLSAIISDRKGSVCMIRLIKRAFASALSPEADTIKIFSCLSFHNLHTT